MSTFVALLRGINVGGNKKVPMAELRTLAEALGFAQVQTYIQSGNLVFSDDARADIVEAKLEKAILGRFGFAVDVLIRTAQDWPGYVQGNPFLAACETEANFVMMALAKRPIRPDVVTLLRERAKAGERIELVGEALWVHYPKGAGTSKLSPVLFDRAAGSAVTARNWRTVQKLAEMLGGGGAAI